MWVNSGRSSTYKAQHQWCLLNTPRRTTCHLLPSVSRSYPYPQRGSGHSLFLNPKCLTLSTPSSLKLASWLRILPSVHYSTGIIFIIHYLLSLWSLNTSSYLTYWFLKQALCLNVFALPKVPRKYYYQLFRQRKLFCKPFGNQALLGIQPTQCYFKKAYSL